ncbi:MAG TPA: DUF177 domain-containing protein [Polyangiaceae bacterium]|nr:DUF177 domain-containing protein [Polyangiaceae bacterium]
MRKKPDFAISVADIDASGKHVEAAIPVEFLRTAFEDSDAEPRFGDGHVDVMLFRSGPDVVVRGRASAKVQLACGRCLEPVEVTLAPEISALMVPASKLAPPAKDEHEMGSGDADVVPYDGETVVLDELLRDELVLDVPMIPLCSESCPGISTQAQVAERAVDPRLAPLMALKPSKAQAKVGVLTAHRFKPKKKTKKKE